MPESRPRYQYSLELLRREPAEYLGSVPAQPDWEPALEWARFSALCIRPGQTLTLGNNCGWVEPVWNTLLGNPYVAGFKAVLPQESGPVFEFEIPLAYFGVLAQAAAAPLVKGGRLKAGELFEYLVCAYAYRGREWQGGDRVQQSRFSTTPVAEAIHLEERPVTALFDRSTKYGTTADDPMSVFLPQTVLDETGELMRQAGENETGGILIGRLCRDEQQAAIFLEVTAQITAQHTLRETTRLTFTPDTWASAEAALRLRDRGEIYLGWWHTHPASMWCKDCPAKRRRRCSELASSRVGDFFSDHDVAFQRAVFPRAYSIALVLSDDCRSPGNPAWHLYGWHQGMMTERGFHILVSGDERPASVPAFV